jgi:sarcosine oxidase subunit alpha
MSVRQDHIGDIPIRLFRVSFTGESGFEVNLPPEQAQRVWDTLLARDVTPYGTDAMHVLRAEKGFISVGQETDGTVTPDDVGLGWTVQGGDFVGRRSLALPALRRADRKQLVGLLPDDPTVVLEEGAQVVAEGQGIGHVTSSYRSATLGRGFALALIAGGRGRIGTALSVVMPGTAIPVAAAGPVFVDKAGERLRGHAVPNLRGEALLAGRVLPAPVARPSDVVQLTVLAATTRLSVRAGSAAATAIGLALGVLLPSVPCRSIISRDRAALWLGPDEWLILAPESAFDLAAQATRAIGEQAASIVDVSHRSQTLEITGPRAEWCLNGFCALDLDLHGFPVGMCTRTVFGKAEVVLWRIAPEVFHLDVARSFVPYVWGCLEEARLEFADAELVSGRRN